MSSFKASARRVLSVILSCAMLCGFVGMFSLVSFAAEVRQPSPVSSDLTFVVPEAIYLTPSASSSTSTTTASFQHYMNNNADGTVADYGSTGNIYYSLAGAGPATLSYSFVNSSFGSAGSGSISLSNSTISNGGSVNITGGTSPSLAAGTSGCYIQWVLSYTDPADSVAKKAYAYTYVYKPYYYPVFAATRTYNERGVESDVQSMAWIAGVHSVDAGGRGINTANFSPLGGVLTLPPQTNNSGGYSQDTDVYHYDNRTPKTGNFQNYSAGTGDGNVSSQAVSPTGYITVDRSRTPNFNQIPNFKIGHLLSYINEGSSSVKSRWFGYYLSDFSSTYSTSFTSGTETDNRFYFDNRGSSYIASDTANENTDGTMSREYCRPRLIYHDAWNKDVPASSGTIAIKGATRFGTTKSSNSRNSSANNSNICHVDVTVYDKGALRTAVQNATKKMAALGVNGISNGNLSSRYFDADNSYKWIALQTAYKAAVLALGKVDGTITNPDTLAGDLDSALASLCTKVTLNANGGSLNNWSVGSNGYVTIGGAQTVAVTPFGQGSNPIRNGYTFKGWTLTTNPATDADASATVTVGYNNTLYAVWKTVPYGISYTLNGGTNSGQNPGTYDIETAVTLHAPTYQGHTFTGWTGSNGTTPQTEVTIPAGSTGDRNFVAHWRDNNYTVVYDDGTDDPTTGSVSPKSATYPENFSVAANGFDYPGHTFVNWKCSNGRYYNPGDPVSSLTDVDGATVTMTAQWSTNRYNVTYDNMLDMYTWQKTAGQGHGISVTDMTETGFKATSGAGDNDGYTGWSPDMPVDAGATYAVITNMQGSGYQVFVDWKNASGGHLSYNDTTDTATSTFTAPANAAFAAIRFDANAAGNSITCSNVRVVKVDAENALLNRSNVNVTPSNKVYDFGATYKNGLPVPTRAGYTFAGWYKDYAATQAVTDTDTVPANALNLWSKWTQITYNISYTLNSGTNAAGNPATYTVEDEIRLADPTRQGYNFTGWTGSNGTTPQKDLVIPKGTTGNLSYTANWEISKYTITFDPANGSDPTVIENVQYGANVNSLKPADPAKDADAQYEYTFTGWKSSVTNTTLTDLPAANADVTYTAQYGTSTRKYTVTWMNSDGTTVLETDANVPYGTAPQYNSATPQKAQDDQYIYSFIGWTKNGAAVDLSAEVVRGNVTYVAAYSTQTRKYTITWYDDNRTSVLDSQELEYNASALYAGQDPAKASTAEFSYEFGTFADSNGNTYDKDVPFTVTGDLDLYASYIQSVRTYTVTWVGADGTLETDQNVPYGTAPSYDLNGGVNPVKASTDQYDYEFSGWKSSVTNETYASVSLLPAVTGNVTFTAQFIETVRRYTVSWKNYDGAALGANTVAYGDHPVYSGETPARASTSTQVYTFSGWKSSGGTFYGLNEELPAVAGPETYTAQYTMGTRYYTVSWQDENSNELERDSVEYDAMPSFEHSADVPAKPATQEYTYAWAGWRDSRTGNTYTQTSISSARITQDTVFITWYRGTKIQYHVTWSFKTPGQYNQGGDIPDTVETVDVDYGVSPARAVPESYRVQEGDVNYIYSFSGWKSGDVVYGISEELPTVTGAVTYTAQYVKGDHVHEYDAEHSEVTTEPTCEGTGIRTYYCTVANCDQTTTEVIPANGHSWDDGTQTTPATCSAEGVMTYECTVCHTTKTEVIPIDPAAHDWHKNEETSVEPDCENTGVYYYYCGHNADHTKREVQSALGHDIRTVTTDPTCVAQGYDTHSCSRCDYYVRDNFTEALGHDFDANHDGTVDENDGEVRTAATCVDNGIIVYSCSRCDVTREDTTPTLIEKLGDVDEAHSYESTVTREATCTLSEKTSKICTVCGKRYTEETHEALGHDYDANHDGQETEDDYTVVPATCTTRGTVTKTCQRCQRTVRVENINPLRHNYDANGDGMVNADDAVITRAATCAAEGVLTYTCQRCGESYTEVIPVDGTAHVWGEGVVTTQPTYSRTGVMTYTCSVCHDTYTEVIGMLERDDDPQDPGGNSGSHSGHSGGNSSASGEGRCSMCDKYESVRASNASFITKMFYSIIHFVVHLFATFSF